MKYVCVCALFFFFTRHNIFFYIQENKNSCIFIYIQEKYLKKKKIYYIQEINKYSICLPGEKLKKKNPKKKNKYY